MTFLSNGAIVTDIDADTDNHSLLKDGYSIRHIETWHRDGYNDTCIVWDAPAIAEADLPY
jgi:hypothetical protein